MVAIVKASSFFRFSNLSFISFINVSVILETPLDLITFVNTTFNVETSGITSDKHNSADLIVFVNSSKGLRILIQLFKMSFSSAVSGFIFVLFEAKRQMASLISLILSSIGGLYSNFLLSADADAVVVADIQLRISG